MSRYHCINKSGPRKGKLKKGYHIKNKRCVKAKGGKARGRRGTSRRSSGGLKPCQRRGKGGRIVLRKNWKYGKGGRCLRAKG